MAGQVRFSGCAIEWSFLCMDISFPKLGVDFLSSNKLMADTVSNTLVNSTTVNTFTLIKGPHSHTALVMLPGPGAAWKSQSTPPEQFHG